MKRKYNIKPGAKFNRLTAVSEAKLEKYNAYAFLFRCDCGNEKVIRVNSVMRGLSKSCGCLVKERNQVRGLSGCAWEVPGTGRVYLRYKRDAARRDIKWNLSKDRFQKLTQLKCYYCGSDPSTVIERKVRANGKNAGAKITYTGIDRVDNAKGYEEGNVVPCCKHCNYAKRFMTFAEFREWSIPLGKLMSSPRGEFLLKQFGDE